MLAQIITVVAVTILVWSLGFLYLRSYLKRRTGSARILAEFQEEVDKLIAEINSATDRGLTLMEDRISSLKTLLEETDKRIVTYKREIERRKQHENAYAELGKRTVVKPEHPTDLGLTTPQREEPGLPPDQPAGTNTPDQEELPGGGPGNLSNDSPRFVRSSIRVEPKPPPFAEQVIHLTNAGFSRELVATHLGTTVAEVELVLALAERNKENP